MKNWTLLSRLSLPFLISLFSLKPLSPAIAQAKTCPVLSYSVLPEPPLSQEGITIPSLWLARDQFGGKLLDSWFIETKANWVVLIVNRQVWSLMDYLERYQFLNRFGSVTRQYGYNMRVCNRQGVALGIYTCNFSDSNLVTSASPSCQIELEKLGNTGLRGRDRKLF